MNQPTAAHPALGDAIAPGGLAAFPIAVRLEAVDKRYGPISALSGLDLRVPAGGVYGFLGRNGAGKSTALRIIMGITLPSAGLVQVFGEPLRGDQPKVRRRIGYVAQEQTFYAWMTPVGLGRFVAGFYPSWDGAEYQRLLRLLEVPADRRIQGFSGGTHAKLALCLALAHRPDLLVLDEPTAGMDAVARREFLELVRQQSVRDGRTTIFRRTSSTRSSWPRTRWASSTAAACASKGRRPRWRHPAGS